MQNATKTLLGIDGRRTTGKDARDENVTAVTAIAHIVKSSLGPIGLDKMLVDEVGDVIVTNDGATILKMMEVEHPAARILVDLAQLQDSEIGDGTTSVVILAAELCRRAHGLVLEGVHPTIVITGYKIALRESIKYIKEKLSVPVEGLSRDTLMNVARTSMSSKVLSTEMEHFAKMVVDAVLSVKTINDLGDYAYPRKAINILKQHGKSAKESILLEGFGLNCTRAAQGMPTHISNAKIALLDFDLRAVKMRLSINITVTDPTKANDIKKREIEITKERVRAIIAAGANVILTTMGIDDSVMKLMIEAGVMGVRRVLKDDMRRIAKVTGGIIVSQLCDLTGEESFQASNLGQAESVIEKRFADDEMIVIQGCAKKCCSTIICRGANYFMLDEMERALNDALWAVARTLEAGFVTAGGGAVEGALAVYLESFAHTLGSREQLAIAQFAESLLVIPKTLAQNAALDATDLIAKLRVNHTQALKDKDSKDGLKYSGLDLFEGTVVNNVVAGVLEPRPSKTKSLQFAAEAAVTVLRIDDIVRLNPPPEDEQQ